MSWKKHFRIIQPMSAVPQTSARGPERQGASEAASSNYASYLPEVYAGHPNRIQRYYQYEDMDRDSDISVALDTIADFCTQSEEQTDEPFTIRYNGEASETETKLLTTTLQKWVKLNDFRSRLWYMFRNTIKNGDSFFLRDPETGEWLWIDHFQVMMVKVDEANGKTPEEYIVRGLDYCKQAKFATSKVDASTYNSPMGSAQAFAARQGSAGGGGLSGAGGSFALPGSHIDMRQKPGQSQAVQEVHVLDAKHVVHLSLSVGMDIQWPFGASLLENIFKVYKQKELLEDSIIIYRVQRAPERRIFYIDVGTMPPVRAKAHIQQIKNEIHQRRIPNRTGGGTSIMDAAYNPLCLDMATRIPLLDGRTLSIAELAQEHRDGKENWVYSCDPQTGAVVPGNITWAGETRKQAPVLRLVLDNGETITCTPDHKIPVLGRGKVCAKDIVCNVDSLISFNTDRAKVSRNSNDYTRVYDHSKREWVFAHRMVAEFFRQNQKHQEFTFLPEYVDAEKNVVHHRNMNPSNNDPRNLAWMNFHDHHLYHASTSWWNQAAPEAISDRALASPAMFNHKVVAIEDAGVMDVGTITVDGQERWHAHHTFATEAGVFVFNSIMEDFFFAQGSEGRGSKVETLPGGDNLGEIGDLDYFTRKLARGLRIPPSYLALADESSGVQFNDGKLGAAMIQEFRFSKYCQRLQNLLAPVFDSEFKTFLNESGINIEDDLFEVQFNPPQNFTKYRQIEVDQAQMGVYQMVSENKRLSERFKFKRWLNLTDDEINENEKMWKEENAARLKKATGNTAAETDSGAGLSAIGMRPGGMDFGADPMGETPEGEESAPAEDAMGGPGAAGMGGGMSGMGGPGGAGGGMGGMGGGMGGAGGGGGPLG